MPDTMRNGLLAAARSLRAAVLPALPTAHATAAEQVAVVAAALEFQAERAGDEYPRRLRELQIYRALGRELRTTLADDATLHNELAALAEALNGVSDTPMPDYRELHRGRCGLTEAVTHILRTMHAQRHPRRAEAHRVVVRHSVEVIDLHRAWFAPQGFDPDPSSIPQLATALRPSSNEPSRT